MGKSVFQNIYARAKQIKEAGSKQIKRKWKRISSRNYKKPEWKGFAEISVQS